MAQSTRPGSRTDDLVDKGAEQLKELLTGSRATPAAPPIRCGRYRTAPVKLPATSKKPSTNL